MYIVVFLLAVRQSLSTDKGPCHMEAPLVCTIHEANLKINTMSLAPFRPFAIPNQNIRRCPGGQRTYPNDVPKAINGNCYFVHTSGISRHHKGCLYLLGGPKEGGNATQPCILGDPQTKGEKIRIGCLTPAFSGAHKRAEMLRHPCILGDPQTKGDKIRIGCLTLAFSARPRPRPQPRKAWMWWS